MGLPTLPRYCCFDHLPLSFLTPSVLPRDRHDDDDDDEMIDDEEKHDTRKGNRISWEREDEKGETSSRKIGTYQKSIWRGFPALPALPPSFSFFGTMQIRCTLVDALLSRRGN